MKIFDINEMLKKLHESGLLGYGDLRVCKSVGTEQKLSAKQKIPLICLSCGARSTHNKQYRSVDNLRAVKKGCVGTGCRVCKTIETTIQVCDEYLQYHNISMSFLVESFDVNELRVQLFDNVMEEPLKSPISHTEIRNMAYGNRPLYSFDVLQEMRKTAAPFMDYVRTSTPESCIKYLGYYKKSFTKSSGHFFNIVFKSKSLIRYPHGLELKEARLSEVRRIIKQNDNDKKLVELFKRECEEHNGTFISCLGKRKDFDSKTKRGFDLYFEYKDQTGLLIRQTRNKARECFYQKNTRKGERMALAICEGIYPDGEWLINTRPDWNIGPQFNDITKNIRLEADIISDVYKIVVERQSPWHYEVVDVRRAPEEVERYKFHDRIKKDNIARAGYKLVEIHCAKLEVEKMLAEFSAQLGIISTPEQVGMIHQTWSAYVRDAYLPYKREFLAVLKSNNCELVSPNEEEAIAPSDIVKILLSCGHISTHSMQYFKQGNGLKMCKNCIGEGTKRRAQEKRKVFFQNHLSNYWYNLPDLFKQQLIRNSAKDNYTCPYCNHSVAIGHTMNEIVEFIKKENGYLCLHCYNSGNVITEDSAKAGVVYQARLKIQSIIKTTSWGDCQKWYQYVTLDSALARTDKADSAVVVTLKCNDDHQHRYSLRTWDTVLTSKKRKTKGDYCDHCNAIPYGNDLGENEHLMRLRKLHPKATFISREPAGKLSICKCNKEEKIGQFKIAHPPFYVSMNNIKKFYKQTNKSYCLCCSVAEEREKPGSDKHLEQQTARLKMRAAVIATITGDSSVKRARVTTGNGETTGPVKSNQRLIFYCHNPDHEPTVQTYDNFFSMHKKGYCRKCLKNIQAKSYSTLSKKY